MFENIMTHFPCIIKFINVTKIKKDSFTGNIILLRVMVSYEKYNNTNYLNFINILFINTFLSEFMGNVDTKIIVKAVLSI